MRKISKILKNIIWAALLAFLVFIGITFLPITRLSGGRMGNFKAFVVQSGSMEPAVRTGSLIFVKPAGSYKVGDIVTIKDGKSSVTHRIIAKKEEGGEAMFTTKGDANEEADSQTVPQSQVFGKMIGGLPFVGYAVGYAKTKPGFLLLVIIPSVIIIYEELRKIKEEIMNILKKKKGEERIPRRNDLFEDRYARPSRGDDIGEIIFENKNKVVGEGMKSRRRMDL